LENTCQIYLTYVLNLSCWHIWSSKSTRQEIAMFRK